MSEVKLTYTIRMHNGMSWQDWDEIFEKTITINRKIDSLCNNASSSISIMNDAITELTKSFCGTMERLKEIKTCEIIK